MELREHELALLFPGIGAQLRLELSNLYLAARRLAPPKKREADPELDADAAMLDKYYFRLLRLSQNLTAAEWLDSDAPLSTQTGDIVELIGGICAQTGDLARLKGIALSFSTPVNSHCCRFHRQGIEIVTGQLLSNALKYTPDGGKITVDLRIDQQEKRLLLSVSDTGSGISEEQMPRLFDRYQYLHRQDPENHGFGLGLPLCRRIAERHGGTILAQSQAGKGTRFVLSIPDRAPNPGEMEVAASFFDSSGGFNPMLTVLADSLPAEAYAIRSDEG